MKLKQLISKMITDTLICFGVLDKPEPKQERPKSSKNKSKRGRPKGSKNKKKGKKHANTKR